MQKNLVASVEASGQTFSFNLAKAETVWENTVGLLGTPCLPPGEGLWIEGCRCIHTCFMRFDIDLVYLDSSLRVVKLVPELLPWRINFCGAAASVIELAAGEIARNALRTGLCLEIN